jgi:putative NIF3 family GTP cyclohydrolase 1 type 2
VKSALTAGEVVNRIKAVMAIQGVPWNDATTRDRFKFGGPETVVTGIATTFMGTFEAITRAAERGLNMIIPHEDTYWNDADNTAIAEADTLVYKTKVDFMARRDIVVFRIHDHMHRQRPDFTFSGTAREVGLDPSTETAPNSHRFVIPETTLGELAARVKKVRGDDAIRVVGDPRARVSRIAMGAGMATPAVNSPEIDVVIGGEQREIDGAFDSPEYVMDAATLGVAKGWIIIGHNMSEESGMQEMADWLRPIVPEVKVQHVRAGNVYWVPK